MELNSYPENDFAEVEQAAFSSANVTRGIGFSPDKMLQGRLFSYGDTERYRLGVNFNRIPVNAPQCPFHSYHRDGQMRTDGNLGATTSYNPNSQKLWDNQPEYADLPLALEGDANHYDHRLEDDHWEQPGNLFRMTAEQKQSLFDNTARAINVAYQEVGTAYCELLKSRPCLRTDESRRSQVLLRSSPAARFIIQFLLTATRRQSTKGEFIATT
jgi:catalase